MISDATLLVDGQVDWSGGMDSNLSPQLIAPNSVARAVNVTFRGGKPTNRPGFSQLALSDGVGSGLDLFSSGYYQGGFFYSETRGNKDSSLICVVDGYVVKINLSTYVVDRLYPRTAAGADDTAHRLDAVSRCYFARAERYLVIQDGVNTPLIWDGDYLYQSGVGPTLSTGAVSQIHNVGPGTIMAYGQGRLFVTNASRTKIFAGDLVYGGSTTQIEITSGVASGGKYRLTTTSNHGFAAGDVISISGHSSEHFINGTWEISAIPASTTFDIDYSDTSATGTGGYVSKANAGQESARQRRRGVRARAHVLGDAGGLWSAPPQRLRAPLPRGRAGRRGLDGLAHRDRGVRGVLRHQARVSRPKRPPGFIARRAARGARSPRLVG